MVLQESTNMSQIKVSYKRHLVKTLSYRIISTGIGFLAMWWASGSLKVGAAFGVVELIYKPLQYYIHERVWYKWIKFGLISTPEKKKKNVVITEEKTKTVVKELVEETPEDLPPPQPQSSKKVLNYSSNR